MKSNDNFRFNPRRYEGRLSSFGTNVLNILMEKWQSVPDNINAQAYQQRCPSVPHRRVLTFREDEDFRPPPIYYNEIQTNIDAEFCMPTHRNILQVSPSPQLVQSVDTSNPIHCDELNPQITTSSYDLINSVIDGNAVYDANNRTSSAVPANPGPSYNEGKAKQINTATVNWDNMFDTDIFPTDSTVNVNTKPISTANTFHIETRVLNSTVTNKKAAGDAITKAKRKNQLIADTVPKKNIRIAENINYRKQKYKKSVKDWLKDVNPSNSAENDELSYKNDNKTSGKAEISIEKVKDKPKKRVVQAQLTNKDGVMKFKKPKLDKTNEQYENIRAQTALANNGPKASDYLPKKEIQSKSKTNNKSDQPVANLDENPGNKTQDSKVHKEAREKKNKPKFIAPIKSQIPIHDLEYNVITIDTNNITDHINMFRGVLQKYVVMVLIYSNGFSQLNNQHTENKCEPAGVMFSFDDVYYYFKECHEANIDVMRSLLRNNRIICYEGKHIIIYFKSTLDLDLYDIDIVDAKIGGSLVEPDHPPDNFSELQKLLSFSPQFTIATQCPLQKAAWYSSLLKEVGKKIIALLQEESLWSVFVDIEMQILPIIAEMERVGVAVDMQKLKSMEERLVRQMKGTEAACHQAAGRSFQLTSPAQIRAILYDELQLDTKSNLKITETLAQGAKSTAEAMLKNLVSVHPLPRLILEYRHLHKAHATFLTGIAHHVNDGVVRPTWVQTAACTGRIASNNPNLQAIPKAPFSLVLYPDPEPNETDDRSLSMRSVYTAGAGHVLLAADFNHVEVRVFAHAAGDTKLQAALEQPGDLFRLLAHQWLGKPLGSVTGAERERTKRLVYAALYGAGCRKVMDILDLSYEQALAVVASFNRTFPCLKSFGGSVVSRCLAAGGRLATLCGRARTLRNIASGDAALRAQAERQAVNFIVQGSAADICKKAMVVTSAALRAHGLHGRLLLQLHDELVWELPSHSLNTAADIIKREMEQCGRLAGLRATLPVSISVGHTWGDMTPYLPDTHTHLTTASFTAVAEHTHSSLTHSR